MAKSHQEIRREYFTTRTTETLSGTELLTFHYPPADLAGIAFTLEQSAQLAGDIMSLLAAIGYREPIPVHNFYTREKCKCDIVTLMGKGCQCGGV